MRRAGLLAVVLALAVMAGDADAAPRCDDAGPVIFAESGLRIFGAPWSAPEESGVDHFACLGRAKRPVEVGGQSSTTGTASGDTPAYAFGGGRFLAGYHTSDGEGGPSAYLNVVDLRARRGVGFLNVAFQDGLPAFRVTAGGDLVVLTEEGLVVKPRGRRARTLAGEGARDLAMAGGTVYWTEGGAARSSVLPGATGGAELRMLEPARSRRRAGRCAALPGRTLTASGSVRVVQRDGRRTACRAGRRMRAGAAGAPAPRIVADRWVLLRDGGGAAVLDTRTGERATAMGGPVTRATLLRDGTLAWIDASGRALARPRDGERVVLAESGASRLAAARRAVYWTEGGAPRRFSPR